MNWTFLNVTWTVITLIGTIASSRVFWLSLGDYMVVRRNPRAVSATQYHDKMVIAEMALVGEFARFFTQAFFFALGVLAIATPPPNRIINNVIIGLFIMSTVLLMISSIKANVARKEIVDNGTD